MSALTDLLRPFSNLLAGRSVLSIGPGTESVRRFLEKAGAEVAGTAAGVPVGTGMTTKFDFVVWVFSGGQGTLADRCAEIAGALKDEGSLLMATENPLGISRSLGSASCDPNHAEALDSGKHELVCRLTEAGLTNIDFYYPFPDMNGPSVLLDERAFETPAFDLGNLIEPTAGCEGNALSLPAKKLMQLLISNGLIMEHCNSFFLVASRRKTRLLPKEILGFCFNGSRMIEYNKMNVFYLTGDNTIMVRRVPYEPDIRAKPGLPIVQELSEERYLPGRLYTLVLESILETSGWTVADLRAWAAPYWTLLQQYADEEGRVEGRYIDLAPFNLLLYNGSLSAVDLEWTAQGCLPVKYVFFRGLYHSLARVPAVRPPAVGTPTNFYRLILAVAETLFSDTGGLLETFLHLEPFYFGAVFPGSGRFPPDRDLPVVTVTAGCASEEATAWRVGLCPLLACDLQVFVETADGAFSEEKSTTLRIALTPQRRIHSVPLPWFTKDILRLR
ncbi:MAG TPA: hypothetical protein VGR89_16740, partial [Puia sp.]|nr:hypothetical protein [Puia sp.]